MTIKYFDHAATTYVKEEVKDAMVPYFSKYYGNASGIYSIGRTSKKALEKARMQVAEAIGASPKEIYFTGCGSESDNLAIKGIAYANRNKGNHIITTKIEHHAVLETCETLEKEGFRVTYLPVDKDGNISLQKLENSITSNTILISIMFANNEVGTIEPVEEIGKIAKKYGVIFHTDSVQAVGNIPIDVNKMNIDSLSMSAHKFYGPKGVGALYVREGVNFRKILNGGHQEKDKRAGTENVAGIVGLGKAIELSCKNLEKYSKKLVELREYLLEQVASNFKECRLNGSRQNRLPGNANISFKNVEGDKLLLELDKRGFCVSAGSACSSGKTEPSHVLVAMNVPKEYANGTIRITLGEENTKEEIDELVSALKEIII